MSTADIKNKIIHEINKISDESLLEEIYQLLKLESTEDYKLTESEIHLVKEGLEDVEKDRIFSSQEANAIIQKWLKR